MGDKGLIAQLSLANGTNLILCFGVVSEALNVGYQFGVGRCARKASPNVGRERGPWDRWHLDLLQFVANAGAHRAHHGADGLEAGVS